MRAWAVTVAFVLGGCSVFPQANRECGTGPGDLPRTGPITSREAAIAAAVRAPGLRQPIVVNDVQHGRMEDVDGAPTFANGAGRCFGQAKRMPGGDMSLHGSTCGGGTGTGPSQVQIVVDAQTGEMLGNWWTSP